MATGKVENWGGNIADIGPIYPMVGSEFVLFVLVLIFWLGWHVRQAREESKQWEEDLRKFGGKKLPRGEYDIHDY